MAESKKTRTSSFGSSRRESHDATAFYQRFEPPTIRHDRDVSWDKAIDEIILGDARCMDRVPTNSVALVVTSPPYFAGKEYEEDMGRGHVPASYQAYLQGLEEVFAECVRTLEPGGRIAVNVANLGRRPYRSLSGDVLRLFERLGLLLRGEVVWVKARGASGSTAWGTFQRPANPVLRDLSERIVIASKGRFDRAVPARERSEKGHPHVADIWRDEFMEATTDIWEIPSESAIRVNHPAPFPVELPRRLMELFTYRDDLVLDPFIGSGTTAVAAIHTGRHYVGYEIDPEYHERAVARVTAELTDAAPGARIPGAEEVEESGESDTDRAVREGRAIRDLALAALRDAGFVDLREKVKVGPGIELAVEATDRAGGRWLFDVLGGFTASRPGLTRVDTLWRAIGRAAVIDRHRDGRRLVLLTSHRPPDRSPAARLLAEVTGPDGPVFDVVELLAPEDMARLAAYADG
jgi:DNA modification methylase